MNTAIKVTRGECDLPCWENMEAGNRTIAARRSNGRNTE